METIQVGNIRLVVAPKEVLAQEDVTCATVPIPKQKAKPRKRISQANLIFARASLQGISDVRKVGDGSLIDEPIEINGWLVMPIDMYKGIIPPEAWQTAETLTKGMSIKGFLVADDKKSIKRKPRAQDVTTPKVSPDWGKIATSLGQVTAAIAVCGAIISFFPLVLGIGAIGIALAYDPLLIAVTAEDEWICVYQWWD